MAKMFIGYYIEDNQENFNIYYNWETWHRETFSPLIKNINILKFEISGKTYQERKNNLIELAKKWQNEFAWLSWSYGELNEILTYFYNNAKKYGLVKEFAENGII